MEEIFNSIIELEVVDDYEGIQSIIDNLSLTESEDLLELICDGCSCTCGNDRNLCDDPIGTMIMENISKLS